MKEKKKIAEDKTLMKEWHHKNVEDPAKLSYKSHKKIWWKCVPHNHEWQATIANRTSKAGSNCPYCANKRVLQGFNDLESQFPELAKEWDNEKNLVKPCEIYYSSNKRYWWKCHEGHSFEANLYQRQERQTGCPYCSGRLAIVGENDLSTTHPELAAQWHEKNTISIFDVKAKTNKNVWWKCQEGHEWKTPVYNRAAGKNCPYCAGNKRWIGYNNFSLINAELLPFWDYEKNEKKPDEYGPHSSAKVWWKCDKGHSYKTSIRKRKLSKTDCAECGKSFSTSFAEKEIVVFLEEHYGKNSLVLNSRKIISPYELDIFIPEKNIAIEYNGLYWHSERQLTLLHKDEAKNYHYKKWQLCQKQGIQLITIWEDDWEFRKDFIKDMLLKRLKHSSVPIIPVDQTVVKKLTEKEAVNFLNIHHIHGAISSTEEVKIGLVDRMGNIVAVMTGSTNDNNAAVKDFQISQFATSCVIDTALENFIKYVEEQHGYERIIVFSDNDLSEGEIYEMNGFSKMEETGPDYSYVVGKKRFDKTGYTVQRFEEDKTLVYETGRTEEELATINKMYRIYDAGKTVWSKVCETV